MEQILLASLLFLAIFSCDYGRYWFFPMKYRYVSYETYFLYSFGLLLTLVLFHVELAEFVGSRFHVELGYLFFIFIGAILSSIGLKKQKVTICTQILRSYKCISPFYIFIKTKEILLQQLLFLIITLGVSREIGAGFWPLVVFLLISLLVQIPILCHVKQFWSYVYGGSMLFASIIFFYTYVSLEMFWPALYIHTLVHTFFWISLAEPSQNVDNWG